MTRALLTSLLLGGCSRATEFPPGVEPLEPLAVTRHDPGEQGYNMASGDDGVVWAHLHGHVHTDIVSVWRAFQEPAVVVDRRRVSEFSTTSDVEEGYDFSIAIDQTVSDIITVQYVLTWRHLALGRSDPPNDVAMRWQKTEGSSLINNITGSVVLTQIDEDVTEITMMEHLDAPMTATDDVESLLGDIFNDVVSHTSGQPLQEF